MKLWIQLLRHLYIVSVFCETLRLLNNSTEQIPRCKYISHLACSDIPRVLLHPKGSLPCSQECRTCPSLHYDLPSTHTSVRYVQHTHFSTICPVHTLQDDLSSTHTSARSAQYTHFSTICPVHTLQYDLPSTHTSVRSVFVLRSTQNT
jgi:hypothetical protein